MLQPNINTEGIGQRAEEWYERKLRSRVETNENIGKMILIDAETGDYEIDETGMSAASRLQARHPDSSLYGMRIGYDAVYAIGGTITRTKWGITHQSRLTDRS